MPTEDTLTYRVELDAADLPQQLEQLRSQMDTALGAMAFSSSPAPPEMTAGPMNFMFETAPQMNAAQQMIDTTSQGFLATNQMMAAQEGGGLMNFLNSNVEAFRLGYAKFHGGMERMGLMVPPAPLVQFPPQGVTAYTEQMEHLQGLGYPGGPLFTATGMVSSAAEMPGLLSGAMGFGYDPNEMPYSRFEFQEMYGEAAGKRLSRGLEENMFTGAFGMAGLAFGPGGALIGGAVGMGVDALKNAGGARRRQGEQVGNAFRRISQRSFMQDPFTKEEGENLANELLGQADTYEARLNRVTRDSIQSQLLDFTREGGFDSARTAEEFQQTAQGVIDNTRKVMQSLRMTQEEATKFMAEMNREGLVSTTDSAGFALDVSANAKVAGMAPTEMLNFMRQGSEAFRGSAFGMGGGMQMLQEARLQTQQLLQTSPAGMDIVRELGGVQAATIGLAQTNANFMQTGMGMIGYNNFMQGGATGDVMAMMSNTYGMSPFDWYRERAQMTQDVSSGRISQQDITAMRIDPYVDRYQEYFQRVEGRGMGAEDYEGMFHWMTQSGITENVAQAQQLFATRFADPAEASDRRIQALNDQLDKLRQPQPITIGDQFRAVMGEVGDAFMDPLRQLDASLHGIFDPLGEYLTDKITGRSEYVDNQTARIGGTHGVVEQSIALRAAAGNLTSAENTYLQTTIGEYEAHLRSQGGVLDADSYNILDKKRNLTSGETEFDNRMVSNIGKIDEYMDGFSMESDQLGLLARQNDPFALPTADYGTLAADENLSDILSGFSSWQGASIRYLGGVDTAELESALGDNFVLGRLPDGRLANKTGFGGKTWGDHDITGVDALIIGQMMQEGTLTRGGQLMSTRGNINNNPANIRVADLATAEKFYGEYGVTGIDDHGFVQFETLGGGFNAARQEIFASINKGQTIREFFHEQSPTTDGNNPDAMAERTTEIMFSLTNVSPWEESIDDFELEARFAALNDIYQINEDGTLKRDENDNLILKAVDNTLIATKSDDVVADAKDFYKVKSGDTFSEIAAQYGGVELLKSLNPNIKDVNKISVGQKINIPQEPATDVSMDLATFLKNNNYQSLNVDDPNLSLLMQQDNYNMVNRAYDDLIMSTPSDRFKTDWPGSGGDYSASSFDAGIALADGKITYAQYIDDLRDRRSGGLFGFGGGASASYITDQKTLDRMAMEDSGFLSDLAGDLSATLVSNAEQDRVGNLLEFISAVGGHESLTLSAENLGLFNRDGQFADMSEGLYLHGKAVMQYNLIGAYDSTEIRANIASDRFQQKYNPGLFQGYVDSVSSALTEHGDEFENEMLDKLNIATATLHAKGLVSADNIASIEEAGEIELIRNTLYKADPSGYSETFLNRSDGDSLASQLSGSGSQYADSILAQAGDDQTLSKPVQALNWKIKGLQAKMDSNLDASKILGEVRGSEVFESLQGKSSWGSATEGAYADDDNNTFWGSIMFGVGAGLAWTGVGTPLGIGMMTVGGTMVGVDTIEAGARTWESANTTHLAKVMARMRINDESLFMTQEDMEAKYGTRNFDELTGEDIADMYVRTIQHNSINGENKFLEDLQALTNASINDPTQTALDSDVVAHMQNAVELGYDIQEQLNIHGMGADGAMLEELRMARGLRAGMLENNMYTLYNSAVGGDAGTYESMVAVRENLVEERKKKQAASTRHRAAMGMLSEGMRGVDTQLMREGQSKDGITQIMSIEQWAADSGVDLQAQFNGGGELLTESVNATHRKGYEDYVATTRMQMVAGKYGIGTAEMKEYGLDTLIKNQIQDKTNEETIRGKELDLDDAEDQQIALLQASNNKLETLIRVLQEGNMD